MAGKGKKETVKVVKIIKVSINIRVQSKAHLSRPFLFIPVAGFGRSKCSVEQRTRTSRKYNEFN